jgi:hypothetical protein
VVGIPTDAFRYYHIWGGGGHRCDAKRRNVMQHDGAPTSEGVKSLSIARPLRPCFHVPQVPGAEYTDEVCMCFLFFGPDDLNTFTRVLEVTSVAHAKEFLHLSQGELHIQLRTLKSEYIDAIRHLGQEAKSFRITTLRDALENATALQAKLCDNVIGEL